MESINDVLCELIQRENVKKIKVSDALSIFVELEKMGALKVPEDWRTSLADTIKYQEME